MKTSHQPFSSFIGHLNKSVYAKQPLTHALCSGRVSFSHIKAIDKKIAECIKHGIYISATDQLQLLQLRDIIVKQKSHCTQKKLAKFDEILKNLPAIKSESCKIWELITEYQNINAKRMDLNKQRNDSFQRLYSYFNAMADYDYNVPPAVRMLFERLIAAKNGMRMLAEFQHFTQIYNVTIPIDCSIPDNCSGIKNRQQALTAPPSISLNWAEISNKIDEIFMLDLELYNYKQNIDQLQNKIKEIAGTLVVLNNAEYLEYLKSTAG
ncbi:hypothetical protein AB4S24_002875 [Salmonella enterica]